MMKSAHIHLGEEKVAKERKRELREILIRTFKENQQVRIAVPLHSASRSMKDKMLHQRWWVTPVSLSHVRLRQKDHKSEASSGYIVNSSIVGAPW